MNEEYEALIRFHVLTSNRNVSKFAYAAVDMDGSLYCYENEPIANDDEEWDNLNYGGYILICYVESCEFWKDTLIEL